MESVFYTNVQDLIIRTVFHRNNSKIMESPQVSKCVFWQPWLTSTNTDNTSKQGSNKQLPTTKWKRDRRLRLPEYSRKSDPKLAENMPPELISPARSISPDSSVKSDNHSESTNSSISSNDNEIIKKEEYSETNSHNGIKKEKDDAPLDMSVRQRGLLPSYTQAISDPSYRTNHRPSVITQAPVGGINDSKHRYETKNNYNSGMSMCDPIIDEHFRRSLGKDYCTVFSNNNVSSVFSNKTTSPKDLSGYQELMDTDAASLSVDDHFAKALGETWAKLNSKNKDSDLNNTNSTSGGKSPCRVVSI